MVGLTREQQERNLAALNRLIQMAHDRGLKFTAGIWDHIYRGGVQGGGIPGADDALRKPTPGLVWGVTAENLVPYTKAALARFVKLVPGLDAIQFRMHDESGLKNSEQEAFWRDVFQMMKATAPNLRLDLRAKGLPDSVIQSALDAGVHFRITTKYWMEQMGLPFHPTHINQQNQFDRRHSYADLLRYPQRYKMHWRLWNGGTTRVLLWGDPDYARRFVESTHLYDGDGFEVNEPLCTKMEAQPHDAKPFDLLTPAYRYYDYEFERYWHFFQVFGRLGYNPDTPAGGLAAGVREALRQRRRAVCREGAAPGELGAAAHRRRLLSLRLLPHDARLGGKAAAGRSACLCQGRGQRHPAVRQFRRGGADAARGRRDGEDAAGSEQPLVRAGGRRNQRCRVAEAEKRVGSHRNKEFDSTVTDLKILADLALFHSRRIPAAVSYRLFERTKDPAALDDAIAAGAERHRGLAAARGCGRRRLLPTT